MGAGEAQFAPMKIVGWCMVLLAGTAVAEVVQVDLPYPELQLNNGKVLRPALIRTFDTEAGTVSVQSGNHITSVLVAWLPDAVKAQLQQLAPPPKLPEQERARAEAARERDRREVARLARAEQQTRKSARYATEAAAAEAANDEKTETAITAAANTKAIHYFKYEFNKGAGLNFTPELELNAPESVSGWSNRHRVTGKAYIRRYANQGSFDSTTRDFEVLVEVDGKGRAKAVDLILK
jgi:hypothetical protein